MTRLINELLNQLADEIDITESQYGLMKRAYNSVADWLNQNNTKISKHKVHIFPQGSMRYGTAIKPINEDDYDIDLVCEFTTLTSGLKASYVKQSVGERISENETYKKLLQKEGRRCWTLEYCDAFNFHMDILPAIPFREEHRANARLNAAYESIQSGRSSALLATDKDKKTHEYEFIPTNPQGYAEWFRGRMLTSTTKPVLDSLQRVPEYPRKTVLQKAIQLLKRHRDVYFSDKDEEIKPISMIITTLVAKCYNAQTQIYEFICYALNHLHEHIVTDNKGKKVIINPSLPLENFADKWQENPKKEQAFYSWLKQAKYDFKSLGEITSFSQFDKELKKLFAQKPVDRLMERYRAQLQAERQTASAVAKATETPATVLAVEQIPHRKSPPWKLPLGYRVHIKAEYSLDGKTFNSFKSAETLKNHISLRFYPIHSIRPPYKVKWQITNTGYEARNANCLRGDKFEDSDLQGNGGIMCGKKESTAYIGTHYIQCFIIQNGNQCVAMSEPFIVSVGKNSR